MASQLRPRSGCPISFSLDIFGDKWTLLVIRDLLFLRKNTYGQFLEAPEKIATNILAQRLAWLEKQKIITKSRDPRHRQRRIYRLTRKGLDLLPILLEMIAWGARYDPETGAPREFLRKLKRDRAGVIRQILSAQRAGTTRSPARSD